MMLVYDYHHHTNNSFDSKATMKEVCEQAIEKGIHEVCFTEHFSVNPRASTYGHMNFDRYFNDIATCQKQYGDKLSIKKGIELCEPHLLRDQYKKELDGKYFDFILGSVHNIDNHKLREVIKREPETAYSHYFSEVFELVSYADIDVIAHFDLMKRYAHPILGYYRYEDHASMIEKILIKAVERHIGIEINTSGLRGGVGETLPSLDVVRRYRELGGEILTIGSDSHRVQDVGAGFNEAVQIAKDCGFDHITAFSNRVPRQIKID
ncbi:histidinol-phosphatase HisJ family protein [Terrilactibacillus laevilacticus]|nr:histidinol-phosphatase HisJ family protein [Terrilactibacillus laevilacticus]